MSNPRLLKIPPSVFFLHKRVLLLLLLLLQIGLLFFLVIIIIKVLRKNRKREKQSRSLSPPRPLRENEATTHLTNAICIVAVSNNVFF